MIQSTVYYVDDVVYDIYAVFVLKLWMISFGRK